MSWSSLRRRFGIEIEPLSSLNSPCIFEEMVFDAKDNIERHVDETAIAVIGEAGIAGAAGEAFDGLVVEAEVEHRVHHAGHRRAGAGADGDEQRIILVAKTGTGDLADASHGGAHFAGQSIRILTVVLIEPGATSVVMGPAAPAGRIGVSARLYFCRRAAFHVCLASAAAAKGIDNFVGSPREVRPL
jgi:hypothetical protein